jgi:two-component system NtrC family response regulator
MQFLLVTDEATIDDAVLALREGAVDYLEKPCDRGDLTRALEVVRERRAAALSPAPREFVGNSLAARTVRARVQRYAVVDSPVHLCGEPGTGKTTVALLLHQASPRSSGPFEVFSCHAVAPDDLRAALFGTADPPREGMLEQLEGGTLLLEGIDGIARELHAELTELLREGHFRPLGGGPRRVADVRVVTTASTPLDLLLAQGRLDDALFEELVPLLIRIPPLRERRADILPQVERFAAEASPGGAATATFTAEAVQALESRDFRRNSRELREVVHAAVEAAGGVPIEPRHLRRVTGDGRRLPTGETLSERVARYKAACVATAYLEADGDVEAVQRRLGVSRATVYRQVKALNLQSD